MLDRDQIELLFLDHLKNAIEAQVELKPGMVYNKEGSKRLNNGVSIVVHSNDHDTHFHVQHVGRGIDAKFSFPSIKFIKYERNKDTFSSRELANIITTCNIPMYREFIEGELQKARRI
jgi:hypothetical protein